MRRRTAGDPRRRRRRRVRRTSLLLPSSSSSCCSVEDLFFHRACVSTSRPLSLLSFSLRRQREQCAEKCAIAEKKMDRCHYGVQGHSSCFASTSAKEPRTEATVLNESERASETDGAGEGGPDRGGKKLKEEAAEPVEGRGCREDEE